MLLIETHPNIRSFSRKVPLPPTALPPLVPSLLRTPAGRRRPGLPSDSRPVDRTEYSVQQVSKTSPPPTPRIYVARDGKDNDPLLTGKLGFSLG